MGRSWESASKNPSSYKLYIEMIIVKLERVKEIPHKWDTFLWLSIASYHVRVTLNTLKEPTMWVRQLLFPLYRWKHRKVIQSNVANVTLLHREGHFSLLQNLLQTRGGKNYFLMPQLLLRTTHENLSTIKQKSIAWNCWDIITQNIIT